MKKILLILLVSFTLSCNAQVYPLRNFSDIPENSYEKDTNNELQNYEGVWKGEWNNKIIYITLKKITYKYDNTFKYYKDYLIAKFKVINSNGAMLFDNTSLSDDKAKIKGGGFRKVDDKYSLIYIDMDLCERSGDILINFTDSTKTKLQWNYSQDENFIEPDCFYYTYAPQDYPQPLPKNIILTRQ